MRYDGMISSFDDAAGRGVITDSRGRKYDFLQMDVNMFDRDKVALGLAVTFERDQESAGGGTPLRAKKIAITPDAAEAERIRRAPSTRVPEPAAAPPMVAAGPPISTTPEDLLAAKEREIEQLQRELALRKELQAAPPAPTPAPAASSSSISWLFRVAAAGLLFWLFFISDGSDPVSRFLGNFLADKPVAEYACADIEQQFRGGTVQNAFGGKFKILEISDARELSRSASELACSATVQLSNATTQQMRMRVFKNSSGRTMFEIRAL